MTLPRHDTIVSFTDGTTSIGTILHLEPLADDRTAVILDATACHPVDAGWPDQGPDRAVLSAATQQIEVLDCVLAASDGITLHLGSDIPVRKGTEGWAFVVAHIVSSDAATALSEGESIEVAVDAAHRHAISRGHTGCHLAALALNRVLADRWSKEVRPDALGSPDFDSNAIDSSLIRENGSTDRYRLNKSLRRKGFSIDGLTEHLPEVQDALQRQLTEWIATDAAVSIEREGDRLTERRSWLCALPDGTARIPCGGTHLNSLSELGALTVQLSITDEDGTPVLVMELDAL